MLVGGRVQEALQERVQGFRAARQQSSELLQSYLPLLDQLVAADLESRLADQEWPGAFPTSELADRGLFIPFEHRWNNAREAREWAMQCIEDVPTVAVDGSQIPASKEFGVPVSLVQVAWFENYHETGRPYVKDLRNEVITPSATEPEPEQYAFAESKLQQRRFVMEMQVAAERLAKLEREPLPVVFIDGSLILSFVGRMLPDSRQPYLDALFGLLDASREQRIPLIGYIDLSYASDLVSMMRKAFGLPAGDLVDAQLVESKMSYFDRTAAFVCARSDILPLYRTEDHDYRSELCFAYIKTGASRLPARVEFPRWVLDAGLLDYVFDVIRAELVIGVGYPYGLVTAHDTAVLSIDDRLRFFSLFQRFAEENDLAVPVPQKAISKGRRR